MVFPTVVGTKWSQTANAFVLSFCIIFRTFYINSESSYMRLAILMSINFLGGAYKYPFAKISAMM